MLTWLLLGLVALVGGVAWSLRGRVQELEARLQELRLVKRELEQRVGEVERGLQMTRTHLADVAAGEHPERAAILTGKAWRDVQPAPALVLYEQNPNLFVLDARRANGPARR
jgi:hypothetical protein